MKGNKRRKKKEDRLVSSNRKKKKEFQRSATRQTLLLLFCLCGSFELGERRKKRNGTSEVKRWHLFVFFFSVLEKQVTPCCCCCCCFCACVFVSVCLAIFLKAVFFFLFFAVFGLYEVYTRSVVFFSWYILCRISCFFFFSFGDAYWQQWSLLFQRIMLSPSPSFISFLLFLSLTYFRFSPTVLHTAISSTVPPPLA